MTQHSILLARADAVWQRLYSRVALCDIALGRKPQAEDLVLVSTLEAWALQAMTKQEALKILGGI